MKKRLCRVFITLAMVSVMFAVSACGNSNSSETFSTEPERTEEPATESEEETKKEVETEKEEETADTAKEEYDPENHIYETYPTFIEELTLEDGVLTVKTADVGFEDFPIPKDMEFSFSYPIADDCKWEMMGNADVTFDSFALLMEGIEFDLKSFKDGSSHYTKGEDFCNADGLFAFDVVNGKVVRVLNVEESIADDTEDNKPTETTETNTTESQTQTSKSAETPKPTETPTPTHEHSYSATVTQNATCSSTGVKTYTCSCGNSSYTEEIPMTDHNWTERYETIHHESKGEMRQVQTGTSDGYVECATCHATFSTPADFQEHCKATGDFNHAMSSYYRHEGGPIYEYQWVVISEAYDETIVAGYTCSTCGATK